MPADSAADTYYGISQQALALAQQMGVTPEQAQAMLAASGEIGAGTENSTESPGVADVLGKNPLIPIGGDPADPAILASIKEIMSGGGKTPVDPYAALEAANARSAAASKRDTIEAQTIRSAADKQLESMKEASDAKVGGIASVDDLQKTLLGERNSKDVYNYLFNSRGLTGPQGGQAGAMPFTQAQINAYAQQGGNMDALRQWLIGQNAPKMPGAAPVGNEPPPITNYSSNSGGTSSSAEAIRANTDIQLEQMKEADALNKAGTGSVDELQKALTGQRGPVDPFGYLFDASGTARPAGYQSAGLPFTQAQIDAYGQQGVSLQQLQQMFAPTGPNPFVRGMMGQLPPEMQMFQARPDQASVRPQQQGPQGPPQIAPQGVPQNPWMSRMGGMMPRQGPPMGRQANPLTDFLGSHPGLGDFVKSHPGFNDFVNSHPMFGGSPAPNPMSSGPEADQPLKDANPLNNQQMQGALQAGIPGFRQGGVVTEPTLAVIGEDQPEAVVPLGSSQFGAGQVSPMPPATRGGAGQVSPWGQPPPTAPPPAAPAPLGTTLTGGQPVDPNAPKPPVDPSKLDPFTRGFTNGTGLAVAPSMQQWENTPSSGQDAYKNYIETVLGGNFSDLLDLQKRLAPTGAPTADAYATPPAGS